MMQSVLCIVSHLSLVLVTDLSRSLSSASDLVHGDDVRNLQRIKFEDMRRAEMATNQSFINAIVDEHNRLRMLHQSPPLKLDEELCKTAQHWANELGALSKSRKIPVVFQPGWEGVGGNTWVTKGWTEVSALAATFSWYSEEKYYTYGNETFCGFNPNYTRYHTDHFAQIVWRSSSKIGCANFKDGETMFVVCHYVPAGNIRGEYIENVRMPTSLQ